jgi:hypothetical protein
MGAAVRFRLVPNAKGVASDLSCRVLMWRIARKGISMCVGAPFGMRALNWECSVRGQRAGF